MAKKKPKKSEPAVEPVAEPAAEVTGDRHRHALMSFRPQADLREVVVALAARERRSVAQVIQFLVEEALVVRGLWNPADQADDAGDEGEGA